VSTDSAAFSDRNDVPPTSWLSAAAASFDVPLNYYAHAKEPDNDNDDKAEMKYQLGAVLMQHGICG
jgi:hypothetical protein